MEGTCYLGRQMGTRRTSLQSSFRASWVLSSFKNTRCTSHNRLGFIYKHRTYPSLWKICWKKWLQVWYRASDLVSKPVWIISLQEFVLFSRNVWCYETSNVQCNVRHHFPLFFYEVFLTLYCYRFYVRQQECLFHIKLEFVLVHKHSGKIDWEKKLALEAR